MPPLEKYWGFRGIKSFGTLLGLNGGWLLWLGVGTGSILSTFGFTYLQAQLMSCPFFLAWTIQNIDVKIVITSCFLSVLDMFFKHFDIAGGARVPETGPVLFACAPHANQFIDGVVAMKAIEQRKDIGFLTAAKTMRRKYVGWLADKMGCIPVERANDVKVLGPGSVTVDHKGNVFGRGTKFTEQFKVGDSIELSSAPKAMKIARVCNDAEMELVQALSSPITDPCTYKVAPRLNHEQVFNYVFDKLGSGGGVAIFPEGGSHDRTELLPLKAGISIMALGALAKYKGLPLKIFPVGLNYFKGHRFRSRVFVDIGEPIVVKPELVEQYKKGGDERRAACNSLLGEINAGIHTVTLEAPNYKTLQFLRAARRLYKPSSVRISAPAQFSLMKAFAEGYERSKGEPEVQKYYSKVVTYRKLLRSYAIPDHKVAKYTSGKYENNGKSFLATANLVPLLIIKTIIALIYTLVALPGTLLAIPMYVITRTIASREARKALSNSSVKLEGRDVIATWKIMVSFLLVPSMHILYTTIAWYYVSAHATVVYFWFMPLFSTVSVLATENYMSNWASIRAIIYSFVLPGTGNELPEMRQELQNEIRRLVRKFKWDESLVDNKNELWDESLQTEMKKMLDLIDNLKVRNMLEKIKPGKVTSE